MDTSRERIIREYQSCYSRCPISVNRYFTKDVFLYTFVPDHSLVAVLTQKHEQGNKYLVAFMSTRLQGDELNYPLVDKKDFSIHKAIKQFRPYILKNHTNVIVPHP
jgi:hypothetical protein